MRMRRLPDPSPPTGGPPAGTNVASKIPTRAGRIPAEVKRMSGSSSSSSHGIGFGGGLGILFITLKLLGKIDWSWWWVLSPLWIGAVIFLLVVGVVVLVAWANS